MWCGVGGRRLVWCGREEVSVMWEGGCWCCGVGGEG